MKWIGITMAAIITAKILAFWQRGYLAYGEELVAIVWVWLVYLALHSEWFKNAKNKVIHKKKSLRLLEQNTST